MDCFKYLDPNSEPLIYCKNSLVKGAGLGIFAKNDIKVNTPVIIYYGDLISNDDILKLYTENEIKYKKNISPYLRKTGIKNMLVNGKKSENQNNLILKGYLVNDSNNIKNIDYQNIKNYVDNKNNNIKLMETNDFPIYVTSRDIKKNEELYVSYGLAYWLLNCNCKPEKIREICNKFIP